MASIDPATMAQAGSPGASASAPARADPFYFAAWRWHFYAGLFVIPFLVTLALSGMVMMTFQGTSNLLGRAPDVVAAGSPLPPGRLAEAAVAAVPGGTPDQFVAPEAADRPAYLVVRQGDRNIAVAVDPFNGAVTGVQDKNTSLYAWAEAVHGTLLLGTAGDRLVEAAASLTILMIVTGLYLWLPGRGLARAFIPRLSARRRTLWRELHGTVGAWISAILLCFCLSGLAWSGIWGERIVQAWSSFPMAKAASTWSSTPPAAPVEGTADGGAHHGTDHAADTHAALGHDISGEVPWALEQVPLPQSDGTSGTPGIVGPVTLDSVAAWAQANGFAGQFKVNLPRDAAGVFTVAAEALGEDGVNPRQDRTVHLDQYSGRVLADIGYADYPLAGKAMAWAMALHMGLGGTWNLLLNFTFLALVLTTCASGVALWWKRRPAGSRRLAAPPLPAAMPMWRGAVLVALALSLAFPMAGVALLVVMALDQLVLSRLSGLRRALG